MIRIKNLSYTYPFSKSPALKEINLTVNKGELILITGPSGSGKSTLIYCLNGLIPHIFGGDLYGEIRVMDIEPKTVSIGEMAKNIGTVFQNPEYQIFMPTVREDIEFGCRNALFHEDDIITNRNRATHDLGLDHLLDRETSELSAGERQKVAIAGIYAVGPKILVFDEPSTNLDNQGKRSFREIMERLKSGSYTIILVEHDADTFRDLATCRYYMEEGTLKKTAPIHNFSQDKFTCEKSHKSDVIIEASGISYGYDSRSQLFEDLNIRIEKGEIVAFIGDNGCGKTTFFKLLMGILRPQSGFISIKGKPVRSIHDSARIAGLLFQNPDEQLFAPTVKEEILLGPQHLGITCDYDDIMARFDLRKHENSHPHSLSKGERQKVAFASIAVSRPEIIILDEPTTGLDEKSWRDLMDFTCSLVKDGVTILFSTHNMKVVNRYASRVITFDKGKVIL